MRWNFENFQDFVDVFECPHVKTEEMTELESKILECQFQYGVCTVFDVKMPKTSKVLKIWEIYYTKCTQKTMVCLQIDILKFCFGGL